MVALPQQDERERFIDHMIATRDLSQPSAGVRIHGAKNSAKTAIVHGMARAYGIQGPTKGDFYYDRYADWHNPIIHHDEKPSRGSDDEPVPADKLRESITERHHLLNPKGKKRVVVNGCTRHWFTENGDRMFNFAGQDERELLATAERLDSFEFADVAADWLAKRGGENFVRHWIEGDGIARHVRWLAENRGIKNQGTRMLVEGRLQKSVAMLQAQDPTAARVLTAVIRWIQSPPILLRDDPRPAVYVGNRKVGVNPGQLAQAWKQLRPEDHYVPNPEAIRTVLRRFSSDRESVVARPPGKGKKTNRYWFLRTEDLTAFALDKDMIVDANELLDEQKAKIFDPEGGTVIDFPKVDSTN